MEGRERGVAPKQYLEAHLQEAKPSPQRGKVCGDVICGHGWSVGITATLAGGHGSFQEIWRKKRDGLFAKQSIFINLYLLNGKRIP